MPRRDAPLLWLAALLCLGAVLAHGGLALLLGQDANWDLRNYHFYNPYAFLAGRRDFDVLPAHVATFYNPLMHIPFYLLVSHAPPRLTGFVMGAVQGLNFALVLAIAWTCLALPVPRRRLVVAALLAGAGLGGAMAISEIGTSFGDNLLSLLMLGALAILVWRAGQLGQGALRPALGWALLAGLIAGLATGLKQPMVVFALGLCLAGFAVPGSFGRRFAVAFTFGIGVLIGIAASDGFWLLDMWRRYRDPLFPYFNEYFRSPWATIGDYKDNRFAANSLRKLTLYPYLFTFGRQGVSEIAFFDLRPVLVYSLFLLWPLAALWRRWRGGMTATALTAAAPAEIVLTTIGVSWLFWMVLFGVYRYYLPMEFVLPLAMVLLLDRLPLGNRGKIAAATALLLAALVTVQPGNWGRVAWGKHYFGVPVPPLAEPDRTIVLMAGHDATAYVVPAFPPAVRFVRIQGWFTGPSPTPNLYDRLMQDLVKRHRGPLFILFRKNEETETARDALKAYGLNMQDRDCRDLRTELERNFANPLAFCPVTPNGSGN